MDLTNNLILKSTENKRTYDDVKKYISKFTSYRDLIKDPEYHAIRNWIRRNPVPSGEQLSINDFITHLDKKLPRNRIPDEEVTSTLVDMFPQWNFDEVVYRFIGSERFLDNLYCPILDKNGVPHGYTSNIRVNDLKKRGTGCRKCGEAYVSNGERNLKEILESLGYDVKKFKRFEGCYSVKGQKHCNQLKFDTYFVKDGQEICMEYDGEQHFFDRAIFGGSEGLKDTISNDKIKNKYTKEKGIKLIRIAYTDLKNIEEEVKKALDTPNQLVLSTNYPKLGWNNPTPLFESKNKREYIISETQFNYLISTQMK